ncbi:MAG: N-acetyltransferase [Dermatophilaceae bacterium]
MPAHRPAHRLHPHRGGARLRGPGVGSAIARFALDDVQAQGTRKVLPLCPFIKAWIGRHRDYIPLVYGAPTSTATD